MRRSAFAFVLLAGLAAPVCQAATPSSLTPDNAPDGLAGSSYRIVGNENCASQ